MFLGNVSGWTSVVGTDIPFETVINSNNKISNNNGLISLRKSGYWNVDAMISVTGVTGDVEAQLYADGVAVDGAIAIATLASGGSATLNISDAVRTVFSAYPDVANISVRLGTASASVDARIRVEYVQ